MSDFYIFSQQMPHPSNSGTITVDKNKYENCQLIRKTIFYQIQTKFTMRTTSLYLSAIIIIFLSACGGDNSRSVELDRREAALAEREKQVDSITTDYQALLNMRDSLSHIKTVQLDTIIMNAPWTDSLVGEWESRLVCISTTCRGYVIGDQRTEHWSFLSDSTGLYLEVTGKAKSPKTYLAKASANRNELTLKEQETESASPASLLSFSEISSRQIRGQKRNTGADNCKLVFSVLLTPRSK